MSKRRLYFLVPGIDIAKDIVNDLLLARIPEKHIHIIAKEGTPLEDLPEASIFEKSDFVPALEKGVALGGIVGMLSGLVAIALPSAGLVYAGGAVILGSTFAGAGVGAWLSSMVGIGMPNSCLHRFEKSIEDGELLMVVEVERTKTNNICELIRKQHQEVDFGGLEPTYPVFP